jgi:hypothetical protein
MPKAPQRWTGAPKERVVHGQREGRVADPAIASLLGQILVAWPHFENAMVSVFERLLGVQRGNFDAARLVFYALVAPKTRIDVMRKLLQEGHLNAKKGNEYDEVIDEFEKLNGLRNKYVHGRWWTHETGDTHLQLDNSAFFTQVQYRKVSKHELEEFLSRLSALWSRVMRL